MKAPPWYNCWWDQRPPTPLSLALLTASLSSVSVLFFTTRMSTFQSFLPQKDSLTSRPEFVSSSTDRTNPLGPIPSSLRNSAPRARKPARADPSRKRFLEFETSGKQFAGPDYHSHKWCRCVNMLCRVPLLKRQSWLIFFHWLSHRRAVPEKEKETEPVGFRRLQKNRRDAKARNTQKLSSLSISW